MFHFGMYHVNSYKKLIRYRNENTFHFTRNEISCKHSLICTVCTNYMCTLRSHDMIFEGMSGKLLQRIYVLKNSKKTHKPKIEQLYLYVVKVSCTYLT